MDVGTMVRRGLAAAGEGVFRLEDRAKRRWPRSFVPTVAQPQRNAAAGIVAAAMGARARPEPEVWADGWGSAYKLLQDCARELRADARKRGYHVDTIRQEDLLRLMAKHRGELERRLDMAVG